MLSGDDIQLLLEARRLGLLTASDASRCLQAIVDAERTKKGVDLLAIVSSMTSLEPSKLLQLRRKGRGTPKPEAVKRKSASSRRSAVKAAPARGDIQILLDARRLGYLSATQVDECLLGLVEAAQRGAEIDLGQMLLAKNLLTPLQLSRIGTAGAKAPREPSDSGAAPFPLAGEWVGDYWLIREVTRAATGILYEALRRGAGSGTVAIKLFAPPRGPSPRVLRRFRHEAALAAALDHPNIVKIHEVSRDRGYDFIVMDFINGRSLSHLLWTRGITPERATKIIATCARAAHYMHGQGVVHRDLKPGNIMVGKSRVCIVDFGLAKDAARGEISITNQGELLGTPAYMAPEQARGEVDAIGPWTDVFALGATLYHSIAGAYHFESSSLYDTIKAISEGAWAPLRTKRPDAPRDLCNVIAAAMAFEASDRPSAHVFARGLIKVLKKHDLRLPAAPPFEEI